MTTRLVQNKEYHLVCKEGDFKMTTRLVKNKDYHLVSVEGNF